MNLSLFTGLHFSTSRILRICVCLTIFVVVLSFARSAISEVPTFAERTVGVQTSLNGKGASSGECELPNAVVADSFKIPVESVFSYYIGAICRWFVLVNNSRMEVSYSWFENGTFDEEVRNSERLGIVVHREKNGRGQQAQLTMTHSSDCGFLWKNPKGQGVNQFWVQEGKFSSSRSQQDNCAVAHEAFRQIQDQIF